MQLLLLEALGVFLLVQSVHDIRKKQLPVWITLLGMAAGILLRVFTEELMWMYVAGMIPGFLCILFAKISREAMGYGDGLLICMIGIYLGLSQTIGVCLWAFFLAGITALFLLITKKKTGKQEIAFVPFLFFGFLLEVLLC